MIDRCGRNIDYLRISVTDRCNLRCIYCMPEEGIRLTEREKILQEPEIIRVCKVKIGRGNFEDLPGDGRVGNPKDQAHRWGTAGETSDAQACGKTEKDAGDRESDSDYKWCAAERADEGFCPGGTGRTEH